MHAQRGGGGTFNPLTTSAQEEGRWSAPRLGRLTRYPPYRRLGGHRSLSGRAWKISTKSEFHSRTIQPVASRYIDYAIQHEDTEGNQLNSMQDEILIAMKSTVSELLRRVV